MKKRFHAHATGAFFSVLAALAGCTAATSSELSGYANKVHHATTRSHHRPQSAVKHSHIAKSAVISSTGSPKHPTAAGASPAYFTPQQRQDYGEWMRKSSDSVDLVKLGDANLQLGNWTLAADQYQDALNLWPDNPDGLYGIGQCAAAAGDLPRAIRYYHTAVYVPSPNTLNIYGTVPGDGFQTNDVKRLMQFALLLDHAGQTQEAVFIYNRAADLLDYERGDVQNGIQTVKVLLPKVALEPTLPSQVRYTPGRLQALAYTAIAHGETAFGSSKEAIAHMQNAVKLYPDSAVTHYYLGEALPSGDAKEKPEYQKAAELGDDKVVAAAKERLSMYP